MEGCTPFFLEIFFLCLVQPLIVPDFTGSPIKVLFYIYSRVFLQFASPSPRPWIYALPSSLPLLDVCLLPITLFMYLLPQLSAPYYAALIHLFPLQLSLWHWSAEAFGNYQICPIPPVRYWSHFADGSYSPTYTAASKHCGEAVRHHLSVSSREYGSQENNPLYSWFPTLFQTLQIWISFYHALGLYRLYLSEETESRKELFPGTTCPVLGWKSTGHIYT